ncbi:putative nuclease HARBI1 [Lucilia sericata]|uniref:putative nuclease HARBI1 n=1 Tax=Lucilia sericata TaxID=13632 RepID=UPI0018A88368|nr:putative nuclease HARBI1 [Lucilia sericata]
MTMEDIKLEKRGCGTSPELQVLVALRCWGRREAQDDAAELHGLTQPTVSRICARVARALARHAREKIKMPSNLSEEQEVMREFKAIKNFPGIIGAIDGTHIKIKKTGGSLAQYYINRKGYYSLNIQVVCDANLKIRDIVARWRGSTHDCRIFNESNIKERFENKDFRGRLLGDSGYKLQPYLFTPLLRPQSEKEIKYNKAHIATRNTVERCFGVWKQRFRCLLDGLTVSLENGKTLIIALAVLHNIAVEEKDTTPDDSNIDVTIDIQNIMEENQNNWTEQQDTRSKIILNSFIQKHF